jgi:hypothetical protein
MLFNGGERERRQGYDLNGNLILSKVGEGVFIVRGEKEPFEAEFLRLAGAKSVAPAAKPDRPVHSPVKPDLHRTGRRTGRRHRICTGQAGKGECYAGEHAGWVGFHAGPEPNPPIEHSTGSGPVAVPGGPMQHPAHRGPRRMPTRTLTRT